MPETLRISRSQFDLLVRYASARKPEEACGILAGDISGTVSHIFLMENIEHSSTLYMMDSQEQFKVFDEMEKEGVEMVAIYHSHPHSDAYPSPRDCELAFYPDSFYLIISLKNGNPEGRAFKIIDKEVEEIQIIIEEPS